MEFSTSAHCELANYSKLGLFSQWLDAVHHDTGKNSSDRQYRDEKNLKNRSVLYKNSFTCHLIRVS
jgi:hypothetical protein